MIKDPLAKGLGKGDKLLPKSLIAKNIIIDEIMIIMKPKKVNIKFNEGILKIEIDKNHNIFMTGPVSEIKNIKIEI